jgi:hypothetical protein
MPRIHKLLCASTLVLGFVSRAYCQAESCRHRIVPLSVYDSEGRTVTDLKPSDFEGKYRGQPVTILSIVPDDRPHRVVILLDSSGGMLAAWKPALTVASQVAETSWPNTRVALIIFGEKINEQIGFSLGPSAVVERLHQISVDPTYSSKSVRGRAGLFDSLLAGLRVLGSPTSADSLYLISGAGEDHFSHAHFDDVASQLNSCGVRLFLAVLMHPLGTREWMPISEHLMYLVRRSGGQTLTLYKEGMSVDAKAIGQSSSAIKDFSSRMVQYDRLELELPGPIEKEAGWDLKFSPEKRKQFKGAQIFCPTALPPCQP